MPPPAAGGFPTIPCGGGSTSASTTNTLPEPCAAGCSATVSPQPSTTTRIRAPQASAQPSTAHSLAPQAAACESAACEPLSPPAFLAPQATARAAGLTRSLARCGRACLGAHALPCAQRSRAGRRGGPISDVGPPRRLHASCVWQVDATRVAWSTSGVDDERGGDDVRSARPSAHSQRPTDVVSCKCVGRSSPRSASRAEQRHHRYERRRPPQRQRAESCTTDARRRCVCMRLCMRVRGTGFGLSVRGRLRCGRVACTGLGARTLAGDCA